MFTSFPFHVSLAVSLTLWTLGSRVNVFLHIVADPHAGAMQLLRNHPGHVVTAGA